MSKLQGNVYVHGFYPELFSVAAGTYASNYNYGAGAATINSYLSYEIPTGSNAFAMSDGNLFNAQTEVRIREKEKTTDYTTSIALDTTLPVPNFGSNELRIRVRSAKPNYPPSFNTTFPLYSYAFLPPLFLDVEIVNQLNVNILPLNVSSGDANILRARLLSDSTLALLVYNVRTQTITPLLTSDIDVFFGSSDSAMTIRVRGDYKSQYAIS